MKKERLKRMLDERTLVLIKPDAVKRGLIGVILERFERAGLKIVSCKLVLATREQLDGHFPKSEDWVCGMGHHTLEASKEYDFNPVDIFGTDDPFKIGLRIKEWNYNYLLSGSIMVLVLQGVHVIDTVRKFVGYTLPNKAMPGTIRGDFSVNASDLANTLKIACENLVHASSTQAEAEQEISNWFKPDEILS
ncbi:MAG: Nucleoside diphosphate kinase [Parcubacteria group bacterium GW2011_GWF2_38_8]|nr:MAG: Nucleoside diphosphate kinase [Parcubacteria group bacterium GW2011_GWF2_38_8]